MISEVKWTGGTSGQLGDKLLTVWGYKAAWSKERFTHNLRPPA